MSVVKRETREHCLDLCGVDPAQRYEQVEAVADLRARRVQHADRFRPFARLQVDYGDVMP